MYKSFKETCDNITVAYSLPAFFCLCCQIMLLIYTNHAIYKRNIQTHIILTKYVWTKPIQHKK